VERAIAPPEAPFLPHAQEVGGEQAVELAVLGKLVVLAARDENDRGAHGNAGIALDGVLELVVHGAVTAVRAQRDLAGHVAISDPLGAVGTRPGARLRARGVEHRLGDGAAVAAVGEHEHPHARLEAGERLVDLVVDQLTVVETPGLVLQVGLVVIAVGYLTAVAGVREQEDVARAQRARGARDAGQDGAARGASGQKALHRELAGARDVGHVAGVGFARGETPVPARVVPGIDGVQADRERQSFGHVVLPAARGTELFA
jgi:hypothetical protein